MPHFDEVIPDRLFQGSYPEPFAFRPFNIVINVSDCDHGSIDTDEEFINSRDFPEDVKKTIRHRLDFARHFWFPVNETGKWDYAAFFGAKRVMDKILMSPGASMLSPESKQSVLVHCSAGAYRSVLITYGWLYSHGLEHLMSQHEQMWHRFINGKRAPKEICKFLHKMNDHPTYGIGGILAQCDLIDQLMIKDHRL
jgi:hypothetical protein